MPKRRTDDVVHVVMTDHDIQRKRPSRDLLAPLKERPDGEEGLYKGPVVLYYPPQLSSKPEDQLYLALAQVKLKDSAAAKRAFRDVIRIAPDSEIGQLSREYLDLLK